MAESDNDLAELNAHLRARQQDVEFARRELELAETSMDVLAEIGIARRQRKLEQGVAEASAELEAAERALEVAELLGQLAINEARQWAEALHSMPAELPDGGHFQYEIF